MEKQNILRALSLADGIDDGSTLNAASLAVTVTAAYGLEMAVGVIQMEYHEIVTRCA